MGLKVPIDRNNWTNGFEAADLLVYRLGLEGLILPATHEALLFLCLQHDEVMTYDES
jgi:hypothetical protein